MSVRSLAQSCLILCNPVECSLPGFSAHGIFSGKDTGVGCQYPSPGDLLNPGMEPVSLLSPALAGGFFTTSATWEVSGDTLNQLAYSAAADKRWYLGSEND